MAGVRVVIAEDAAVLREGLAGLLASRGLEVVATVADAEALRAAVAADPPDVAVVDVRMPPTHTDEGLRAAIDLRRRYPDLPVLVFSQYIETRYAAELLADRSDGVGYLLKDRVAHVAEFVDAVRRVATGGTALDPEVVAQLLTAHGADPIDRLTPREREVLALMAEGHDNTTISRRLVVTENAVHKHIGNIFTKLDLAPSDSGHRRVRAVLTYLNGRGDR